MRFGTLRFQHFAPPDGGFGGGPAAPAASASAPSAPAAPAPAPAPSAPAAPAVPLAATAPPAPAPAAPSAPRFTYDEDRSAWVPPTRLATLEQQLAQATHRAQVLQAMTEAAGGVKLPSPTAPVDPRVTAAREALEQVYPGIGQFYESMPALVQLAQTLQQHGIGPDQFARLPEIMTSTDLRYRGQARAVTGSLLSALKADAGGTEFSPAQRGEILGSFERWLRSDAALTDRYLEGDPALVEEFLTYYRGFTGLFGARTTPSVADAAAVRTVQGLPAAPAQGAVPPAAVAPPASRSFEDRASSAWAAMTAGRRP